MKKVYLNVGLSENDAQDLKSMVKNDVASSKTEFIRTALRNYLNNLKQVEIGRGALEHDKEGRITGYNKRYFVISLESYGYILKNLKKNMSDKEVKDFLFNAGIPAGFDAATKRQRETGTTRTEAMKKHAEMAKNLGWGEIELKIDKNNRKVIVISKNPWEAESYLEIFKEKSKKPVCFWFSGYLKGALDVDLGVESKVKETKCVAMGDPHCEYELNY